MRLKYIISGLILCCLIACEKVEKIENFPLVPSKLVVNCLYTSQDHFAVELSKSLVVIDNAPHPSSIEGAKIELYENDNLVGETETFPYLIPHQSQPGKTYKIKVTAPKFSDVQAESNLPQPASITATDLKVFNAEKSSYQYEFDGDSVFITSYEIIDAKLRVDWNGFLGQENYYVLKLKTIEIVDSDTLENKFYANLNNMTSGEQIGNNIYIDASDRSKAENSWEATISDTYSYSESTEPGDLKFRLKLEIQTLSKEAFLYFKSFDQFKEARDNPFADPVQVYNNIENGFGIFGGSASDEAYIELEL